MFANFIEETCTGTGNTITLTGASQYGIPFAEFYANTDSVPYVIVDADGTNRVGGVGTYNTGGTITRNDSWSWNGTTYDSSPASNITLTGGTHVIRVTPLASDFDNHDTAFGWGDHAAENYYNATNFIAGTNYQAPLSNVAFTNVDNNFTAEQKISSGTGSIETNTATNATFNLDTPTPYPRGMAAKTNGVLRWVSGVNFDAETGSNAGSNYFCRGYDDTGVTFNDWLVINRANGQVDFEGGALRAGVLDSTRGRLDLYGDGGSNGGIIYYYNGATSDTEVDYWITYTDANGDWRLDGLGGTTGGIVGLLCDATSGNMFFYQNTATYGSSHSVGINDTTRGTLSLYGDSSNNGGRVRLYNGATADTSADYWQMLPDTSGNLVIESTSGTDVININAATGLTTFGFDVDVAGDLTVTGTVDGVDMSTVRTTANFVAGTDYQTPLSNVAFTNTNNNFSVAQSFNGGDAFGAISAGSTGGRLYLEGPPTSSTISGDVAVDIEGNFIRFFESGGTFRGARLNITECAASAVSDILHDGNADTIISGLGYIKSASGGTVTNVTVGTGLDVTNGTTTPNITLDLAELTDMTTAVSGSLDELILLDSGAQRRKLISEITLSDFSNDLGWTSNIGDITAVTAGNGLTGGATSGAATVTLGTPGSCNGSSLNSVSTSSHTHAISLTAADVGAAASSHTHSASNITAGTFGTGNFTFNGTVTASGFTVSSDLRKKENISNYEPIYLPIQAKNYNFINDGIPRVGYIAQEVDESLPQAVITDDEGMKSVDYTMVHTIKIARLEEVVETQANQINNLIGMVEQLMGKLG